MKNHILCVIYVQKRQNLVLKRSFSWDISLIFSHRTLNMSGFLPNMTCTHIISTYTRQIFVQIFSILKCYSWVARAYAPMFNSEFPQFNVFLRHSHVSRHVFCFSVFQPNNYSSCFSIFYNQLFCIDKLVKYNFFLFSVLYSCDPS
jgi:hypothetical protein